MPGKPSKSPATKIKTAIANVLGAKSAPKASRKKATAKTKAPPATPPAQSVAEPKPADLSVLVSGLVEQLQRGDLASRSAAAVELGRLRDDRATAALVATLRDSTAEIARDAATILSAHQEASVTAALIEVITNRDGYYHSLVRAAAAESLGRSKALSAFDALAGAVRDPIVGPSIEAIRSLAALGDPRAAGVLVAVLRNRDGYHLDAARAAAAEALSRFQEPAVREALQHAAADAAENPDVRRAAVAALNLVA